MRYTFLPALLLPLLTAAGLSRQPIEQAPGVVETKPLDPADEVKQFKVPPGFEVQLVASDPDIQKPMNLAFDDQGRLWLTDTVEYPHPAKKGKPRDTVKVLSDFGPDGRAGKITTFADGMNIPIGLLPLTGASPREALVFGIPSIQRLSDTSGKGVADKREAVLSTYGSIDTHGMTNAFTVGFDGWVYACHGFNNTSKLRGKDGKELVMNSGNTYRFKPDGSTLEQYTWGQVNPFGLSLDPWGNLYSADCHSEPIYQLIRGGIYPSFGKPHDGLGFAPEMITRFRGSTAICGVTYYAADAFPKQYHGATFVGDVMTNQIMWFDLSWAGTTPKAAQKVFLESKDRWCRPVDIKLGPDGALYFADFYNCIIGHYEVDLYHPKRDRKRGRVWRIVYTGKDHKGTPAPRTDFTKATVKGLVADLAHPNLTVRMFAQRQLVHRGKEGTKAVRVALKDGTAEQRAHGMWVLEQLGALDGEALAGAAKEKSPLVRAHAMRVLSERAKVTDAERELAQAALADDEPRVRRAAADALGRHPHAENVRPLLALRHKTPAADTHLVYTARVALRNQMRLPGSWEGAGKWDEKDARAVADAALGTHTADSAAFVVKHLGKYSYPLDRKADLVKHATRYGRKEDTAALSAWAKADTRGKPGEAAALLRAIERGSAERGTALPDGTREWANELAASLLAGSEAEARLGAEVVAVLRLSDQEEKVLSLASVAKQPEGVRVAAMNALAALDAKKHAATLGKVLADADAPAGVREQAAAALARANQTVTRGQLLAALPSVSSHLQGRIAAGLTLSREGCTELVQAVESGKASARLLTDREVAVRIANSRVPGLKEKAEKLTAGLPAADARVAKLIEARRKAYAGTKPDAEKGVKLFEKHCANCHQVAGKGAKVGPQLDGIGLRGLERLLEDTLDPNRNVDAAFRQTTITTMKGQVVPGLVLREEGEVVVMADQQGKEVRVAKKDIEKREVSPLSPMPGNLGETIPEGDFHHLMAYLLTLKPAKK